MFTGIIETLAKVEKIDKENSNVTFTFSCSISKILIIDHSVAHNVVSLTVVDSSDNAFSVHVIPYTFENTNFKNLKVGDTVNLEFDVMGKYVAKFLGK